MFTDLLRVYSDVLEKVHEETNSQIEYLDVKIVQPLTKIIKESKSVTDRLETSIDLLKKYNKQLLTVENLKSATKEAYKSYEQGCLVDDLIYRVVQTYSDDYTPTKKEKAESLKVNYYHKDNDYGSAIVKFNHDIPKLEVENVDIV